jgi:hypothetical protein
MSPARSDQPVSCTPSDTGSKEKSVVENVTSTISTEAIRRGAIFIPKQGVLTGFTQHEYDVRGFSERQRHHNLQLMPYFMP